MHRFYEPLVVLYVLDHTQGDRLSRAATDTMTDDSTVLELRRHFLEALSYLCDFEKGGETMSAIFVTGEPLTYHFARNKTPDQKSIDFLADILSRLSSFYDQSDVRKRQAEGNILEKAVLAGQKRLSTYWSFLQASLDKCEDILQGQSQLDG